MVQGKCSPICEGGCESGYGYCLSPGQCSCLTGYRMTQGRCEPICTRYLAILTIPKTDFI